MVFYSVVIHSSACVAKVCAYCLVHFRHQTHTHLRALHTNTRDLQVSKDVAKSATVAFAAAADRAFAVVSCNSAEHGCVMVTEQGQMFHLSIRNPNGRARLQCAPISKGDGGVGGVLGWGTRLIFGRSDASDSVRAVAAASSYGVDTQNAVAVRLCGLSRTMFTADVS
jgi:hypothetical protein